MASASAAGGVARVPSGGAAIDFDEDLAKQVLSESGGYQISWTWAGDRLRDRVGLRPDL